jgi:hypothetical protein
VTTGIDRRHGKRAGYSQRNVTSPCFRCFGIAINPSFAAPLVLTATVGEATLVSMADTRTSTTMNINTVSNLVAALMSATGNPLVLPAELASGQVTFDERSILAKCLIAS